MAMASCWPPKFPTVEQYREHNPYAKDYETSVQHTGRERLVGSQIEALGTRERVIGQSHNVEAHPHDHIARNLPVSFLSFFNKLKQNPNFTITDSQVMNLYSYF